MSRAGLLSRSRALFLAAGQALILVPGLILTPALAQAQAQAQAQSEEPRLITLTPPSAPAPSSDGAGAPGAFEITDPRFVVADSVTGGPDEAGAGSLEGPSGAVASPEEVPMIRLAPESGSAGAESTADLLPEEAGEEGAGTGLQEEVLASPLPERDSAGESAGAGLGAGPGEGGWLMAMRPQTALPHGYKMGASYVGPGLLRLSGETAALTLRLDLPDTAPLPGALRITYRSSVNVLPDLGRMTVTVNEGAPVVLALDALGDFLTREVAAGSLRTGENLIRLELEQPHRIYCGPDASFGVWTEIAMDQSGVELPQGGLSEDAHGFALAALGQLARGQSLELLSTPETDPALVRGLAARLGRALGPTARIELRSFYSLGRPRLASVALIASDRSEAVIRRGAEGGLVLQIEHHLGRLPDLAPVLAALPSPISFSAPALDPEKGASLADLGVADFTANTHYSRRDIPFDLPGDWLLMGNQKARLDLHYGFARGLPRESMLLVKINDETIRLLPLDREGGELQPQLPIGFNANLLHPGRNQLSFEMMIPGDPGDAACQARRTDMLVVLSESRLSVPPSPPMVLPGLSRVLRRLAPEAVLAPAAARESEKAAARALSIATALEAPEEVSVSSRLQVVGVADFQLVPLETAGISLAQVQSMLYPELGIGRSAAGAAVAGRAPGNSAAQVVTVSASPAAPAGAVPAPRGFRLVEEGEEPPAAESSLGLFSSLWQDFSPRAWLMREARDLRDSAFIGSNQSLRSWAEGRSGEALLLRPDRQTPGDLWLMVGPEADPVRISRALNVLRAGGGAQGEAALLQADGSWQVWSPIRPPVLLRLPDAAGWLTAIGNYASWSPFLFTMLMLGLALLSAVPALFYVLLSRRHTEAK